MIDRCKGLMLLETFTAKEGDSVTLPDLLVVLREVTGDPAFSMFNLSLKDEFCSPPKRRNSSEVD